MHNQPERAPFHPGTLSDVVGKTLVQELVPFVIPDMNRDLKTGVFITLALGRAHPDRFIRDIYDSVQAFMEELDILASNAERGDHRAAVEFERRLNFPERSEARFGYTGRGHSGSAVGDGDVGVWVRNVLLTYPALRRVLVTAPDALQLIPRLDMDRISDIILTIALREFIRITQHYAVQHSFSASCMREYAWDNVWNAKTRSYDAKLRALVPCDHHGRPILLVPTDLVRGSRALDSRDYLSIDPVSGKQVQEHLSKTKLLEQLGRDPKRLESFAQARLVGIRPHARFQKGPAKRRSRKK
jgi:hypothetical protein